MDEIKEEVKFSNDDDIAENMKFVHVKPQTKKSKNLKHKKFNIVEATNSNDINELVENRIKDFENQIMNNPLDSERNLKLSKKILYEKARAEVFRYYNCLVTKNVLIRTFCQG